VGCLSFNEKYIAVCLSLRELPIQLPLFILLIATKVSIFSIVKGTAKFDFLYEILAGENLSLLSQKTYLDLLD